MSKLIQKTKRVLFGPPGAEARSGAILSSAAPVHDHKPPPQPVRSSCEIDEESPDPKGDGWRKLPNGDRVRTLQFGSRSQTTEDEPPRKPKLRVIHNKFKHYDGRNLY